MSLNVTVVGPDSQHVTGLTPDVRGLRGRGSANADLPSKRRIRDTDGAVRRSSAIVTLGLASLVWVTAVIVAPSIGSSASDTSLTSATASSRAAVISAALIYAAGAIVCHQRPERSFHRDGKQLPVCARCLGLYGGGLIGVIGWAGLGGLGRSVSARARRVLQSSRLRLWLVFMALPTLLTMATAWLGWWDAPNVPRTLLALPFGAAIGALVCAVVAGDLR